MGLIALAAMTSGGGRRRAVRSLSVAVIVLASPRHVARAIRRVRAVRARDRRDRPARSWLARRVGQVVADVVGRGDLLPARRTTRVYAGRRLAVGSGVDGRGRCQSAGRSRRRPGDHPRVRRGRRRTREHGGSSTRRLGSGLAGSVDHPRRPRRRRPPRRRERLAGHRDRRRRTDPALPRARARPAPHPGPPDRHGPRGGPARGRRTASSRFTRLAAGRLALRDVRRGSRRWLGTASRRAYGGCRRHGPGSGRDGSVPA